MNIGNSNPTCCWFRYCTINAMAIPWHAKNKFKESWSAVGVQMKARFMMSLPEISCTSSVCTTSGRYRRWLSLINSGRIMLAVVA